jgi:hypothetical protein
VFHPFLFFAKEAKSASGAGAAERTLVNSIEDAPDRRYWTAYDHFMVEREARAMRRAYVSALIRQFWKRMAGHLSVAFAHAGAQPPKAHRARVSGL